jgi:hypothetical protein
MAEKSTWWGRVNPVNQTTEEIARATRLSREANEAAGKRHHGQQDDLGSSDGEVVDGTVSGGHHPKFN